MAVFDELNDGKRRLEDPEARKAEQITRKGEPGSLKRKSSGITLRSYKNSITVVYWTVALAALGVIGYFGYLAIAAFTEN